MEKASSSRTTSRAFERKIFRARLAGVFEQVWLKLWLVLAVAAVFLLVSYVGIWPMLPTVLHVALLGVFGLAALAALGSLVRVSWPSRDDAIRRIERASGVPHRPATSYEDTVSAPNSDPTTTAIWQAHRARMAALLAKLRPGKPSPRTDRFDPFALRAALVLAVVGLTGLLGGRAVERVGQAFTFASDIAVSEARLDAWLTPPAYTGRPPVMLADGSGSGRQAEAAEGEEGGPPLFEVPIRSHLIVRVGGMGSVPLSLAFAPEPEGEDPAEGGKVEIIEAEPSQDAAQLQEVRHEMTRAGTVRALAGSTELARWRIALIPDNVPRISLTRPPELTPRGSLKLTYNVQDDYGVASGEAKLKRLPDPKPDPSKAWARPALPKGPRLPLVRPPKLELKLPKANASSGGAHTYFDVAPHPWAGRKVILTLEATDVAGQVGRSPGLEMILPERNFKQPLARAVVEQRRKLMDDSRYRKSVLVALDALTMEPEGFIDDTHVYLGLRTAYHRLNNTHSRAALTSVIDQLWQIALRIEDGTLSDAERRLKDAQDKLAKALEGDASDEEIRQLMQELREALQDFMQQLAEQNDGQQMDGLDQDQQTLGQQDLERLMRDLEDMAESGSREQAQQLLAEMQDLMERLQSGQMDQAQQQRNREMMQMMDELGDMVGDQQSLMDDTFGERRGDEGQQEGGQEEGGPGSQPPPGMKGLGQEGRQPGMGAPPGMAGQQPQQGGRGQQQGQGQGQQGQRGQGMSGRGQQQSPGSLAERQRQLRERLDQLQQQMGEKGVGASQQLEDAENAMRAAEDALERGDLADATEQQSRALDQMRQGAQQMAQEMMENSPQRYGQGGDTPRDPLGRPQRSQGPDLGTSVKVPDQIDVQRAREILEELRRRLGEATRAPQELDYLERLLRRF